MVEITKQDIESNIWETFYDRINDQVSSVTISDGSIQTVQTITGSFPDKPMDEKADYPIIVIESPSTSWSGPPEFTLTKKKVVGTITMDAYATSLQAAEKLLGAMNEAIETYRKDLRDLGLMFVKLDSTDKDEAFRGKIKLHMKSSTWSFEWIFTATRTY